MKRKVAISMDSTVVADRDQVSANLAGEAVILHLQAGVYYGLNEVAAQVWSRVQKPVSVGEIRDHLVKEYDVKPEQCEADLAALLQEMVLEGIVELKNEPSS